MVTAPPSSLVRTGRRRTLAALSAAGLLLALALLTTGGDLGNSPTQLPTAWADVILILAGGAAIGVFVVRRPAGGGALSFALFAAVALLTALSIGWSVAPDQSWEESGRTVAYLAVFGTALVGARIGTRVAASAVPSGTRLPALASSGAALAAICGALGGLCLWALAVKVLNLPVSGQQDYGPLMAPFTYQNATGVTGAMALPGMLWLAARPGGSRLLRGLGLAGIAIAASVVVLTYSRSALAAALLATVVPLVCMGTRRRAVLMLAVALLGALPIAVYGLGSAALSADTANSLYGGAARIDRGGAELLLGLIIVVVALALTAVGSLLAGFLDGHPQPPARLRQVDRGLLGLVALIPLAVIAWLVFNSRGPFGEISHLWRTLTSVKGAPVSGGASRLQTLSNSRAAYWRQALSVGEHNLVAGTGAGSFFPAHLRYPTATLTPAGQDVKHAHSYVFDTFASFGLIGVLLNGALLLAWCRDALSAAVARFAPAIAPVERDARWTLIGVVIAFGVSSALDWTWYFPGVAVPALAAAGWIAGAATTSAARAASASAARDASASPARDASPSRAAGAAALASSAGAARAPRRPLVARPGAILALTAVAILTFAVAWESLAPIRAIRSADASLDAQLHGDGADALADARAAVSEDPLSASVYERLASVEGALGEHGAQQAQLITATTVQPDNPEPFTALGGYLVCHGHDRDALAPLERATMLDITDSLSQQELLGAARARVPASPALCDSIP